MDDRDMDGRWFDDDYEVEEVEKPEGAVELTEELFNETKDASGYDPEKGEFIE